MTKISTGFSPDFTTTINGEELCLLPQKAIYWRRRNALLVSDTHFGKISHFRKAGIAVPREAAAGNFQRFRQLLLNTSPGTVYILGDLFHSELNAEWLAFKELVRAFPRVKFHLIMGNHDILHELSYANLSLEIATEPLSLDPFLLSHEPLQDPATYNLCGHLHPGVRMITSGRQSMRLPCFYFSRSVGILPAFGEFTGLHLIRPQKMDRVFVIAGNEVLQAG